MLRVTELLHEFVELYQLFFPHRDRKQLIYNINTGDCGYVAWAVANVLRHEGYSVKLMSHCLHVWVEVDGVAYDTMYPEGYPQDPILEWKLREIGNNDEPLELHLSDEGQDGYSGTGPFYALLYLAWAERHRIPFPNFCKRNLSRKGLKRWRSDYRRLIQKAYVALNKARTIVIPPYVSSEQVIWPYTHYYYGEFEKGEDRVLRLYPFTRPVKQLRLLNKDSIEKEISVWRL